MQKEKNIFGAFLAFILMNAVPTFSQDSLKTDEIIIYSTRLQNFSTGTKIQTIDSAALAQYGSGNMADLLSNESPLFIKSYGLGSLAVSSFRGGNASQTATLWNGFALNNPMYGQLDFALVPVGFSSDVRIQYGGTSALWGSAAVGGVIHINNKPKFNRGTTVGANFNAGSFQNFGEQVFVEFSEKKIVSSLKFFNSSARNNFEYYNSALDGNPKVRQLNAERKSYGVLSENSFKIGKKQNLNVAFWYQFNDRNIPPTMTQLISTNNQKDESYRATAEWQYRGKKVNYFIRSAYFDEGLNYNSSLSRSKIFITESEMKYTFSESHFINAGLNNTLAQASSEGYTENLQQDKFALFASYRYQSKNEKISASASLRQEMVNNKMVPFTYSAGGDFKITKWLSAKSSFSKVYRVPTLNDLYWNPGGNPDLMPESGFSGDAGLILKLEKKDKVCFRFEPSIFNRNIDNWIIWLPGQTYWSPQNVMKVWSRGVESVSRVRFQIGDFKMGFSVMTNYAVSTNMQSKSVGDASVGRQLIYVPMYSGHAKFWVEYKGFLLSYSHSYTGYRYTSTDNTQYLAPFNIANIYAAKNFIVKGLQLSAFVQIDNLFNQQYQVVLSRAMPLRYYNTGLTIKFNHATKIK
ncbi:MAG: TonB-dependent receptor [Bacteroidetes bacterium]|nr:TonB-dependent receptor [Bacteroidota bacterium]